MDGLRQTRKLELQREAAQQGDTITEWYDDLGISGRGEFYPKRVALSRARRAALVKLADKQDQAVGIWDEGLDRSGCASYRESRAGFTALTLAARLGELLAVVAWDFSRLFRDLVGQELWLEEMEGLGVSVYVQDLPFAVDAPTRRLLRQEMGLINEYQAARIGALFSAALNQRVEEGLWVGRTDSQWGLRYDVRAKGFVRDEATAPLICRLYETFNVLGGSASRTARTLNRELDSGASGALGPPKSRRWDATKILLHVRDPLYRRRTSYNGAEYDAAHLIPKVVPAAVVAETDRLLAARQALCDVCAARFEVPPEPYLYSRRLRCAGCGTCLQAYPRQGVLGPLPGLRVSWVCGDSLRGGACREGFSLPQPRLTALLDRGLRQAFAAARQGMDADPTCPEEEASAQERRYRRNLLLKGRVNHCNRRRAEFLESYAAGLLTDRAALDLRLAELSARQAAAREEQSALRAAKAAGPGEERWRESEAGRLQARFEAAWPRDAESLSGWLPRDLEKAQFLSDLGLTATVRLYPMQKAAAPQRNGGFPGEALAPPRIRGRSPFLPRQRCGLCEIDIVCPVLGIKATEPLHLWETDQELKDYNQLRLGKPATPG